VDVSNEKDVQIGWQMSSLWRTRAPRGKLFFRQLLFPTFWRLIFFSGRNRNRKNDRLSSLCGVIGTKLGRTELPSAH
jgi:hypothetical protein